MQSGAFDLGYRRVFVLALQSWSRLDCIAASLNATECAQKHNSESNNRTGETSCANSAPKECSETILARGAIFSKERRQPALPPPVVSTCSRRGQPQRKARTRQARRRTAANRVGLMSFAAER